MILASVFALVFAATPPGCTAGEALKKGQQRALQRSSMAHVRKLRLMAGVTARPELVCDQWARVRIVPPPGKTDEAWVLLYRDTQNWKVKLGPGTSFSPEDLKKAGAPAAVWPRK